MRTLAPVLALVTIATLGGCATDVSRPSHDTPSVSQSVPEEGGATGLSVEHTTWGKIKSTYKDGKNDH